MTVRELRQKLFEIENQELEVFIEIMDNSNGEMVEYVAEIEELGMADKGKVLIMGIYD